MSYYGDEEWDYEHDYERERRGRRPPAQRYRSDARRSQQFLDPNAMGGAGLYRTRSQGAQPAPNVYIYNDMIQDANQSQRSNSKSPPYPVPYPPPSPRHRSRNQDDDLAQGVLDLALDNQRLRSRSRGRSDALPYDGRSEYYERQWRDMERQRSLERERERIKQEYEIKALREEEKRKADAAHEKEERNRIIAEYEMKALREEEKRKADAAHEKEERKRIIAEYERRQREESEERKAEEERIRLKLEHEEKEAKEKKEKAYQAFLAEQKAKAEKEKAEKKEAEEKFEDEMRKRLRRFGYTEAQIEAMVKEEADKKDPTRTTISTTTMTRWNAHANPVYPKIHVKYLSIDTLRYYELPWEYDPYDNNYVIIKREMDKYETEVLFEHTRKLRAGGGKLLLEPKKEEKQYAFYRKRDRSRSRIRKVGILEM